MPWLQFTGYVFPAQHGYVVHNYSGMPLELTPSGATHTRMKLEDGSTMPLSLDVTSSGSDDEDKMLRLVSVLVMTRSMGVSVSIIHFVLTTCTPYITAGVALASWGE